MNIPSVIIIIPLPECIVHAYIIARPGIKRVSASMMFATLIVRNITTGTRKTNYIAALLLAYP